MHYIASYCNIFGYKADQKYSEKCVEYFAFYLQQLRKYDIHQFTQIDIIAHSMGNHILIKTILHCLSNNELNLFKECNIICVAADADKDEYHLAIKCLIQSKIIKKWFHYWNNMDYALLLSNVANKKIFGRAGQGPIDDDINDDRVESIKWTKNAIKNGHSYINNIFDTDDDSKTNVSILEKLGVQNDIDHDEQKLNKVSSIISELCNVYLFVTFMTSVLLDTKQI